MNQLIEQIQQNVEFAPWIIFFALLFAGLNLPVSEDVMLFISALLAARNPEYATSLFIGVYAGAYFSDLISYTLGRFLGPKLWNIKFFAKMVSQEQVSKIHSFYDKYGVLTLILGRFIPFGVRNGLFLTAGLGRMNFIRFALSDLLACSISCSAFFALYYFMGETVIEYVKKGNIILFSIAIIAASFFFFKRKKKQRKKL